MCILYLTSPTTRKTHSRLKQNSQRCANIRNRNNDIKAVKQIKVHFIGGGEVGARFSRVPRGNNARAVVAALLLPCAV